MKDRKRLIIGSVIFVVIISFIALGLSFSFAAPLENDVRVKEDSDLTYYIDVIYDGKDSDVVTSSDSAIADVHSDYIEVTDKIPEGLIFQGFVNSDDGSIGAVKRSDNSSCAGYVVDGYNGLKYDSNTRTVSFKVKHLQAGCKITVGIITKTPTLGDKTRMDFYNTAYGRENQFSAKSNTVHVFMGREDEETYTVTYQYQGNVPDNAPEVPTASSYPANTIVGVSQDINIEGYLFSGWTSSDVVVSNGIFTMPSKNVVFTGSFTEKQEQVETVTYTILGDAPVGYLPPLNKSHPVGSDVKLDSLKAGDVIDGYRFLGWTSDDVELPTGNVDESIIFTMPNHPVTLVGKFERIGYQVTYQFQGTVIPDNADSFLPETKSYYPGDKVTVAPYPEADGYRFLGWYYADEFEMPEENVVIYGEWMVETAVFSPTIKNEIVDKKKNYHQGDIVTFNITVNNTADFPIRDVILQEKTEGIEFVAGDGYEVLDSTFVKIGSIPANSSVTVESRYTVGNEGVKEVTNTVELTGALADNNYYLDTSKDYTASAKFNISNISLKINKTDEEGNPLTGAEFTLSQNSLYDKMASTAVLDNVKSEFVSSSTGIDFSQGPSDTNGKGLYIRAGTENDKYPIYYYRGVIDNNHVKFANFCWKIVRTTETGGVKLIYDGVPDSNGYCNNTGKNSQIGTSAFNSSLNSPADVGYMYGTRYTSSNKTPSSLGTVIYGNDVSWDGSKYTLKDTIESSDWENDRTNVVGAGHRYTCLSTESSCSTVYYVHYTGNSNWVYYMTLNDGKNIDDILNEMFPDDNDLRNQTDSTIKTVIDTWYQEHMLDYTKYLEDTIWCNDRSIYQKNSWDKDYSGTGYLYFGGYGNVSTYNPRVTCPNKNDSFTVSSEIGNGKLTYPVALLTADEATLAGHRWAGYGSNVYLNTGQNWWLFSSAGFHNVYASVLVLNNRGYLDYIIVNSGNGVRPSISLAPGTMIGGGDGTSEAPYTVQTSSSISSSDNLSFSGLEPGSVYTLREVKAPTGYQLLGETLTVKVDSNGNVTIDGYNVDNKDGTATVSITNKKINVLPNTGGIGIIPYIFVGLLLVIGGVVCCVKMIRKGGDEHKKSNH